MKLQFAAIALLSLMAMPSARTEEPAAMIGSKPILTYEDVRQVAPPLAAYTQNRLLGDAWKRPGLAPRDRSIVTLAALIARNQTIEMPYHFNLALDNGVKPREISEIITHLAFYAGWANAMSAVAIAKDVFAARHIGADELSPVSVTPLPVDEAAEFEARDECRSAVWWILSGGGAVHHRRAVPRSMATPRPCAKGPQSRHCQRADRQRADSAAYSPSQQGNG